MVFRMLSVKNEHGSVGKWSCPISREASTTFLFYRVVYLFCLQIAIYLYVCVLFLGLHIYLEETNSIMEKYSDEKKSLQGYWEI